MKNNTIYASITEKYSKQLLYWAIKKTGNRTDAEDLAQEVLLQVFLAVDKGQDILNLEHFLWKVARYVWCNHMRQLVRHSTSELSEAMPDEGDFAEEYAESESMEQALADMRHSLADLNRLQREMMVLHYLDGLSVREVAVRLGTTESAVTWQLFDARKRIREDLHMKTLREEKSTVYRPGKLFIGYSGEAPAYPDTQKVSDSLLRQNLCLLCHSAGKTVDELAKETGIPKPFLEFDLDWLVEHEFLTMTGKRYYTTFLILNQKYFENRIEIYTASKERYLDVIINELWRQEEQIRKLGFYGSDFPAEKLYWSIVMMFTSYCSRNSSLLLKLKNRDGCEIRPDGGKYYVMASDRSDGVKSGFSHLEPCGWNDFYGICSDSCLPNSKTDSYYWLGVYNYAAPPYHPEIVTATPEARADIHKLYCKMLEPGFSVDALSSQEKERLAAEVESGLVKKEGNQYLPQFVIFTVQQLATLQQDIFAPLLQKITPQMEQLSEKFFQLHKEDFPRASACSIAYHVYLDLWDFGIFTLMFAAEEGKLRLPEIPGEGVPLTLVLVK